jgi:hypothetical protein
VVERREDVRREWRRTAALDQPGQRMEVHTALARQLLRESRIEAGVTQTCTAPRDDIGRFLPDFSLLSGNKVHVYLAHRDPPLLPPSRVHPTTTAQVRSRSDRPLSLLTATIEGSWNSNRTRTKLSYRVFS